MLAAQLRVFRDPFIILVALPTSMFVLIPLNAGLATINIYTQIGLVTLIGLISKHGILMVDFANKLQADKGLNRRAAIEEAAATRLRPILMTTAAMVVAMVPLLIAKRGCREPLRHRRGDRRRHDHRHEFHPVRHARGLYLPRQGLSKGAAREAEHGLPTSEEAPAATGQSACKSAARMLRPKPWPRLWRKRLNKKGIRRSLGFQFGGGSGLDREGQGPQGRPQASQAEAAEPGSRIVTGLLIPNEPLEVPG